MKYKIETILDNIFWFFVAIIPLFIFCFANKLNINVNKVEKKYKYQNFNWSDIDTSLTLDDIVTDWDDFSKYVFKLKTIEPLEQLETYYYYCDYSFISRSIDEFVFINSPAYCWSTSSDYIMFSEYNGWFHNFSLSDYSFISIYSNFVENLDGDGAFYYLPLENIVEVGYIVEDEYLGVYYEETNPINYHNFISDNLYTIFNDKLGFNMPMVYYWFLSWFLFVLITHLLFDFLAFIPRFCHDLFDKFYHCGGQKK